MRKIPGEDSQSRKRHWLAEENESTKQVPKKRPRKGLVGFLFHPFDSFLSMFARRDEEDGSETQTQEVGDDVSADDEDIVVEKTVHVRQDTNDTVIYLNRDTPERAADGGEVEEIVVEKHIQHNVEVSDDSDSDEVHEIPASPSTNKSKKSVVQRSLEEDQDEYPAVVFEKVVKTPNRELIAARRFQDELIYLNEREDSPEDVSVISGIGSLTPYDSAGHSITPMSLANYSSSNFRDYWRRSYTNKPTSVRSQMRQRRRNTSSIQKVATGVQKDKRPDLSSRDRLLEGIVASGQYDVDAILGLTKSAKLMKSTLSTADVIARANNKMEDLRGSRNTSATVSRESSVIFEGSSSKLQRTPSISSTNLREQKFKDLISQIDSLGICSSPRIPQRYEQAYEISKRKEDVLMKEARLRQEHRAQTRGDRLEQARKNLEQIGIVQRPKIEKKKKVDDFMVLPDASDTIIENAWNRRMNAEEEFVNVASIPICRKDLDTLRGLNWLNDNIINVYLQMICDRSAKDTKYPKTYFFNTFFYTNIVSKGYASVKRWTRKVDIFAHDIILIPVHLGMHWCMAVIDMTEKKIEFYDSLYDGNTQVLPALKNYLAFESLDKKKTAFDFTGWTIRQMEDIPRQQNGSDCGVFSCQFGEWASRRTAPRFTQKNMPYYRKRMVYEIVSQKLLATI